MTIKKYGTGGKPEVVDDQREDEPEKKEPEDEQRDDDRTEPVAPES